MTIRVIHLRGTNEPFVPGGVSTTFLDGLDQSRFEIWHPDYPADYGLRVSFAVSNRIGRDKTVELIRSTSDPVVLSGYSAGAYIMGDLARDIAKGKIAGIAPEQITAVALLADPKRPEGSGAPGLHTPGGYGIAGRRGIPGVRVFWGTSARDPIAALSGDNPLRSAADLTKAFTMDPRGWDEWAQDMFNTLVRREIQPWWMFWLRPGRWGAAIAALNAYIAQGAHTDDYLRLHVCTALAGVVNRDVREL